MVLKASERSKLGWPSPSWAQSSRVSLTVDSKNRHLQMTVIRPPLPDPEGSTPLTHLRCGSTGPVPCGPWWPHSRGRRQHTLLGKAQRYLHQHTEDMGQGQGEGGHCCPHPERFQKMGLPDRAMNSTCLNLSNSCTLRYQFSSKNNLRSSPHVLIQCAFDVNQF